MAPMTTTTHTNAMAFRPATAADDAALRRLAALDSTTPLSGTVLLAELDGDLVAARSLADDRAVADPFVRTAEVLEVLRAYAARLSPATTERRSAWSFPPQRRHLQASA
jgi:hypothetical protein